MVNRLVTRDNEAALEFVIDGDGAEPTTGEKGQLYVPFACYIDEQTMLADQTGDAVVDIWKDSYGNFPPTVADTICASAKPTISSGTKDQDAALAGWTRELSEGDVLAFNLDSISTITRLTISLKVTRR